MSKIKAWFVALSIAVLLGAVVWLMWDYALRGFWVLALIFAGYGFLCFVFRLEKWLETDMPRAGAHVREETADMDEADAALWEQMWEGEAPPQSLRDSSPEGAPGI